MNKPDEPAFPSDNVCNTGLTVRAYIAAKALQGILANGREEFSTMDEQEAASQAVRFADALIAELSKPSDSSRCV